MPHDLWNWPDGEENGTTPSDSEHPTNLKQTQMDYHHAYIPGTKSHLDYTT